MTGPDLKPCPFCGGNAEYRVTHDEGQRNDYDTIECLSCRAEMSVLLHWAESEGANRNTLTTAWNTRDPAVLAALPEVQAMIAAAYEVAARETLTLVLASVTDIASTLLSVGDAAGANGLCVLLKTLEQHADTIPKSVSDALTPADADLAAKIGGE